ncbi:MAG TPA: cytochrome P450 [Parachlamydiaceae bacterium]|nr:cytochrome P450 [Parachlamydiaceae bacterium]
MLIERKIVSDGPNDLRAHFSNKWGVYSPEDQTITWTADNNRVRIVSYPQGRSGTYMYQPNENGNYLGKMLALAKKAAEERGEGVFSQTVITGTWPYRKAMHWHVFFDPRLTPIVTSFSRYPQAEDYVLNAEFDPSLKNDLATPYNSSLSKQMVHKVGLFLSSFGLPPESYAVLHKSIRDYFKTCKPNYNEWAEFADQIFFKIQAEKNEFLEGHAYFSTMAWATVSKFILGVPEAEFVDHAHIWNALFQPTKGMCPQMYAKMCFSKMESYVLKQIRGTQEKFDNKEEIPATIIHYWIQNNIAFEIIKKLPESDLQQACEIAKNRDMTIEEMVYVDNFFGVMIGMQETIAFTLTQIACHFARDELLATRCKNNLNDCSKMVNEALRFMPPAGISRELRWDSDVVDGENIYHANKGDQFITMPALTMHLDEFTPEHADFDIDRTHINSHAFSEGPHKCPGQLPALGWLAALTHKLAHYEFTKQDMKEPDYFVAFILRDGDRKFKMSLPGHAEESYSSSEEQLLTFMF